MITNLDYQCTTWSLSASVPNWNYLHNTLWKLEPKETGWHCTFLLLSAPAAEKAREHEKCGLWTSCGETEWEKRCQTSGIDKVILQGSTDSLALQCVINQSCTEVSYCFQLLLVKATRTPYLTICKYLIITFFCRSWHFHCFHATMEEQYGTIYLSIFTLLLCSDIILESAGKGNINLCALLCS